MFALATVTRIVSIERHVVASVWGDNASTQVGLGIFDHGHYGRTTGIDSRRILVFNALSSDLFLDRSTLVAACYFCG